METLEELKAIIAGKPEGATHIDDDGDYIRYELDKKSVEYRCSVDGWWEVDFSDFNLMRSLSDIERIIELEEKLKSFADDISDCNCIGGVSKTLSEYGL